MSRFASLFLGKSASDTESSPDEKSVETGYTVLFVDDEVSVLNAMRRIFRRENYTILTAASAEEALQLLEKQPVQVILSDHQMPGMTGADLLRRVKDLYPRIIRIMLTGHADVNAIMSAVNEGAVYKFITKPWNDDDLRITVGLALEQYDLIKENTLLKKRQEIQQREIKQFSKFVDAHRSQVGSLLLKKGLLRQPDLDRTLALQVKTNKVLPVVLTELKIVDEALIIDTITSEMGIDRVYPREFSVSRALVELIPREICIRSFLVPLKRTENRLIVAMVDPTDYVKVDDLRFITGFQIQPVVASQKEILDKLEEIYGPDDVLASAMSEIELTDPMESIEIVIDEDDDDMSVEALLLAKDQPPAIRVVTAIISDALRHGASDVHIEPKAKYVMVRYRIDGLLQDKIHIPIQMHPGIVSRIKVMSELDIAERRRPQDGRVTVKSATRMADMRISTLPTINGEKIVLRILDRNSAIKDVADLGLSDGVLEKVLRLIDRPQGMVLATGPTGSGKTSTLYSLMQKIAKISKNYTTIEDPVEYFMSMAEQVMVREKIGLSFPMVLRSLLRQDPDVILLGEIRDFETAEVACHAALTGHLVLSTLHTNGSVATITRMRDMGIQPYVISESLSGIIAQKLLRRNCPNCLTDTTFSEEVLVALGVDADTMDFTPRKGKGCPRCSHTGFSGRLGLFEVLAVDGEIKELIHKDATEVELMRAARWAGMATLIDDGIDKVRAGLTTLDEVLRVLGPRTEFSGKCPHCGIQLKDRFQYCPFCATAITPRCPACTRIMEPGWTACPDCGKTVAG